MLTVEDGTGIEDADSYESAAGHVAYAALYGFTVSEQQAEINVRKAMDYVESFDISNGGTGFKGKKAVASAVNALAFPRTALYINGTALDEATSLLKIKKVLNEVALGINQGADPTGLAGGKFVKVEAFGVLRREFDTSIEFPLENPRVALFLSPLLKEDISPYRFKVSAGSDRCVRHGYGHNYGYGYSYDHIDGCTYYTSGTCTCDYYE